MAEKTNDDRAERPATTVHLHFGNAELAEGHSDEIAELRRALLELGEELRREGAALRAELRRIAPAETRDIVALSHLAALTLKQNATLQMILRGATNAEIAERLQMDEGTVKGTVKAICNHLRLKGEERTRHNIRTRLSPTVDGLDASEYERISGLPKNWDAAWTPADRGQRPLLYAKTRKAPAITAKRTSVS